MLTKHLVRLLLVLFFKKQEPAFTFLIGGFRFVFCLPNIHKNAVQLQVLA